MQMSALQDPAFAPFRPLHKERRHFARLPLSAKASIQVGDQALEVKVENLSIKGAFVTPARQMEIDEMVAFIIYHPRSPQHLCSLKAQVVRMTDKGIGLRFEKTLLD